MSYKPALYNVKCNRCAKFFPNNQTIAGYGKVYCMTCAYIRKINNNTTTIPQFILKKYSIKNGDEIQFELTKKGILVKKHVNPNSQ